MKCRPHRCLSSSQSHPSFHVNPFHRIEESSHHHNSQFKSSFLQTNQRNALHIHHTAQKHRNEPIPNSHSTHYSETTQLKSTLTSLQISTTLIPYLHHTNPSQSPPHTLYYISTPFQQSITTTTSPLLINHHIPSQ